MPSVPPVRPLPKKPTLGTGLASSSSYSRSASSSSSYRPYGGFTRRRSLSGGKRSRVGKKWTTAIAAAQQTMKRTGSFNAARKSFRKQGLKNARKLFGSLLT